MKVSTLMAVFFIYVVILLSCSKGNNDSKTEIKPDEKIDTLTFDLANFPAGSRPEEIGLKLTELFLQTKHSFWGNVNSQFITLTVGDGPETFMARPPFCGAQVHY